MIRVIIYIILLGCIQDPCHICKEFPYLQFLVSFSFKKLTDAEVEIPILSLVVLL